VKVGPFTIARTQVLDAERKALQLRPLSSARSWWPVIRESFTGAWQQNVEITAPSVVASPTVYACASLIAGDVSKLALRLVQKNDDDIWEPAESPAFSPVLRKPNRYQTVVKFVEQWILSKLLRGNAYVLKQRDGRGIVTALYPLDATRVTPLVSTDGSVYYEIKRDELSELRQESIIVPASEIIHDIMCALWHPLVGVSPISACGIAALQGLAIQNNSQKFFTNGSFPSGFLTAPGHIADDTAARLKDYFQTEFSGDKIGRVAVGGDGLKYEAFTMTAVDAQLIDQLKWTSETICSCFHVPPYMVGIGSPPPYANIEPAIQQYYAQAIQTLLTSFETSLDEGLGLIQKIDGVQYGTEFDVDDLIWMDTATKMKAAADGIGSGGMAPNEARFRYLNLGKVPGGDTPYMQQQMWPLKQLAEREIPAVPAAPPAMPVENTKPETDPADTEDEDELTEAATFGALLLKGLALHA
jgi:HK97 family phage portal protein